MTLEEQKPRELRLGFLAVEQTQDSKGFIGAFMATDERGYPLEFRVTTPVRPTSVQRALYGAQLDHFVSVELCAKTLLSQAKVSPAVVLTPDPLLLDISLISKVDVIAIWQAGSSLMRQGTGVVAINGQNGAGEIQYETRLLHSNQQGSLLAFLETCAGHFDLLETFSRMREALKLLAQEDKKFA